MTAESARFLLWWLLLRLSHRFFLLNPPHKTEVSWDSVLSSVPSSAQLKASNATFALMAPWPPCWVLTLFTFYSCPLVTSTHISRTFQMKPIPHRTCPIPLIKGPPLFPELTAHAFLQVMSCLHYGIISRRFPPLVFPHFKSRTNSVSKVTILI